MSLLRSLPPLLPLGILTLALAFLAGPGYWCIAVGMMTLTYLVSGLLLLVLWKHFREDRHTLKIMGIFYCCGATGAILTALPLAKLALKTWSTLSSSCVMMVPQCCGVDELLPGPVTRCSPSLTPCRSSENCIAAGMTDCRVELKPSNNGSLTCSLLLGWEWVMTPGLIEECSKALWFLLVWFIYRKLSKTNTSTQCRLLYAMAVGAGFETSENIRYAFPELVSMDYSLWPYIFHLDFAPDVFTHLRFIACLHRSVSSFLHVIWTGYFGSYLSRTALLLSIALHGLYDFFGTLSQTHEASGGYTYVNVYVGKIGIFITVAVSLQLFADRVMSISEVDIGDEEDDLPLTRTQSLYDPVQYSGLIPRRTLTTQRSRSFKTAANVFKECIEERNHVNDWAASMSLPSHSSSATAYMIEFKAAMESSSAACDDFLRLDSLPATAIVSLVGEGNLHAVVTIANTGNPTLDDELQSGKLIRICKAPVSRQAAIERSEHYLVVSAALGGEYLPDEHPPKVLVLARGVLRAIDEQVGHYRVRKRIDKCPTFEGACFTTSTSGDQCHAQIMTDISTNLGADTITFELKPKCGIRAVPGYPCRFVMQRSDDPGFDLDKFYDPYRLYFGHDIYGEVKKLFDQRPRGFLKLRSPGTLSTLPRDAVCEAISTVLRSTPILSRLAALQNYASIDEALPDFAAKLWEWLVEQCRLDPSIVIRHHYPHTLPSVEEFRTFEAVHDIGKVTEWLSIFLLGRMAMDVSLFLSFSPQAVGPPFNQVDEVDAGELFPGHRGKPLWCRLTVIDTDPKPFSKLPFYFGQLAKCKVKFEEHSPAVTE